MGYRNDCKILLMTIFVCKNGTKRAKMRMFGSFIRVMEEPFFRSKMRKRQSKMHRMNDRMIGKKTKMSSVINRGKKWCFFGRGAWSAR